MEKPKSLLVHGNIPENTECPFAKFCRFKAEGTCKHRGKDHGVEFSCASARGFDLINQGKYTRGFNLINQGKYTGNL
jgi:hypothetical protein